MLKPVITATALMALAGASFAYAEHGFGGDHGFGDGGPRAEQRHRLSARGYFRLCRCTDRRIRKPGCSSPRIRARIGRRSSRRCAISFNCGSSAHRPAKPANSSNSRRRRRLSGSRSAPTIWPRPARRSKRSPMPARRCTRASMTIKKSVHDARAHAATPSWHAWRPRTRLARRPPRAEPFFLIALLLRARCSSLPAAGVNGSRSTPAAAFAFFGERIRSGDRND